VGGVLKSVPVKTNLPELSEFFRGIMVLVEFVPINTNVSALYVVGVVLIVKTVSEFWGRMVIEFVPVKTSVSEFSVSSKHDITRPN
jgi:hypothetical protein